MHFQRPMVCRWVDFPNHSSPRHQVPTPIGTLQHHVMDLDARGFVFLVPIVAVGAVVGLLTTVFQRFEGLVTKLTALKTQLEALKTQLESIKALLRTIQTTDASLQTAVQKMIEKRKLVVVSPDHWFMATLCHATRMSHAKTLDQERESSPGLSTQELKTQHVVRLLKDLKHERLTTMDGVTALSKRVVLVASVYSELLPEHEPLHVEVALTYCLHEWMHVSQQRRCCVDDVEAFDAFLLSKLKGERAQTWLDCQLIIDTLDPLTLAHHFYKQRITNQALRDLISLSITESSGDEETFFARMLVRLAKNENKAALAAWDAWLGEEIATIGYVRRHKDQPSSLGLLEGHVINPTQFEADKRAYFPIGTGQNGIGANSFADLSGVIAIKPTADEKDNGLLRGFLYEGGELLETEHEAVEKENTAEEGYEVVAEPSSHPHTD